VPAYELYLNLMRTIRGRFDVIDAVRAAPGDEFLRGESAAFHVRKIVEGIAFGCLVAIEHGMKSVPRDAKGQWNAEKILRSLQSRNLRVLPSPSLIRKATPQESSEHNVRGMIEGIPDRRLDHAQLIKIYQRLHPWLHEANPYNTDSHEEGATGRGGRSGSPPANHLEYLVIPA